MNPAHRLPDARGQFARLISALGRRIGHPLLPDEGAVALSDDQEALHLMVELSTDEDCIHAIRPFLEVPDDEAEAGRLASELLRVNADRDALGGSLVCTYAPRHLHCLVLRLELDMAPAAFVMAIEELAELGDALRASLQGQADPVPRPANLHLHRA